MEMLRTALTPSDQWRLAYREPCGSLQKLHSTSKVNKKLLTCSLYVYKFPLLYFFIMACWDLISKSLELWFLIFSAQICQLNFLSDIEYSLLPTTSCFNSAHIQFRWWACDSQMSGLVSLSACRLRLPFL